ncbi:MAG: Cell death protease [Peltula sp. TS41687]|nr:MAG: Cell death protease [Peltula sp. TS41687]
MVVGDKTAADYFVRSMPGAPEGPLLKMHAGHITVDPEHNGNLFFWHFQNRHIANRQRTVIWLNGGPGCSSMDGALMEVGPYRVKDDGTLRYNDGSWDEFANLLFVDQPVGTGFSYVNTDSYIHELKEMADQFIVFLERFFALFPEYEHDDIYFAGESYAGQHIPYIAQAILNRNEKNQEHKWALQGLLIGNGWIAPTEQYLSYLPMAYQSGLIQGDSAKAKQVESQQSLCTTKLNEPGGTDHVDIAQCEKILTEILKLAQREDKEDAQCVNMYDIRLRDSYPSCGMNWPPDLDYVTPYLRRQEVIKALNVNPDKKAGWTECVGSVGSSFKAAHSKPSITLLPSLLEHMPIILFSGDQDLICNHMGTEELIHRMEWNGGKGFELSPGTWAPRRDWTFEGEAAGIYQEARNLTYILFYNASHMVPFDYPRRTRDMLDRFIGVDIASIGGQPVDSRIDGEKGREVSVGGHPNSTIAREKERQRLAQAEHDSNVKTLWYLASVLALVLVGWGVQQWCVRRRRRRQRHHHHPTSSPTRGVYEEVDTAARDMPPTSSSPSSSSSRHQSKRYRHGREEADLEAADFDENELDDLHDSVAAALNRRPQGQGGGEDRAPVGRRDSQDRFDLGRRSEDEASVDDVDEGIVLKSRNSVSLANGDGKRVDR